MTSVGPPCHQHTVERLCSRAFQVFCLRLLPSFFHRSSCCSGIEIPTDIEDGSLPLASDEVAEPPRLDPQPPAPISIAMLAPIATVFIQVFIIVPFTFEETSQMFIYLTKTIKSLIYQYIKSTLAMRRFYNTQSNITSSHIRTFLKHQRLQGIFVSRSRNGLTAAFSATQRTACHQYWIYRYIIYNSTMFLFVTLVLFLMGVSHHYIDLINLLPMTISSLHNPIDFQRQSTPIT